MDSRLRNPHVLFVWKFVGESDQDQGESGTQTLSRPKVSPRVNEPPLYRVVLLNDDYTPMDFVVTVLRSLFQKTEMEAVELMLKVHQEGKATAGIFPIDVAEMKALQVHALAQKHQHPLKCSVEKDG